jgi:hypothetical protein
MDVERSPSLSSHDGAWTPEASALGASPVWSDAEARFYARGLATSDYVAQVGIALKNLLGDVPSLLDVGAGTGALGRRLVAPNGRWTAVEPNNFMACLLEREAAKASGLRRVIRDLWQNLPRYPGLVHDGVLATNMGGPIDEADHFVATLRPLARRWLCWTVPAQKGPSRYCLSGFLPPELHGEDEVPGVARALARLSPENAPDRIAFAEWTFRAVFPDCRAADAHFLTRFGGDDAARRRALRAWLAARLTPTAAGWVAEAKKTTAILLWRT